jgi:hypothetical protein
VLFYDLPISEISTFRERVLAVTPDDIQRVARQYVKPDRLSIVLVGNARAFASQLIEMGFNAYEVISVNQLDVMSPSLKRERPRPAQRRGSFEPFDSFALRVRRSARAPRRRIRPSRAARTFRTFRTTRAI